MSIDSYADVGTSKSLVPTAERLPRIECRMHSLIQSHHFIEKMNWIDLLKHFRVGKVLFNPQKTHAMKISLINFRKPPRTQFIQWTFGEKTQIHPLVTLFFITFSSVYLSELEFSLQFDTQK